MPGTRAGGIKAAETNKQRYGKAFYKTIGAIGGKNSSGGGFKDNPQLARLAGKLGGMRRSRTEQTPEQFNQELAIREEIKKLQEGAKWE